MYDHLRENLGHRVKRGGISIPDSRNSVEWFHAKSAEACEALAELLFGGADMNYARHTSCVQKASTRAGKAR